MGLEEITQQDRLKKIIKTNIAPAMKKEGFKKNRNWFSYSGTDIDKHLFVTSTRWGSKESVDFTLELYVMPKGNKPIRDKKIAFTRIGSLKTGGDPYYHLTPRVDSEKLGQEIEQDIAEYIIPFFKEY